LVRMAYILKKWIRGRKLYRELLLRKDERFSKYFLGYGIITEGKGGSLEWESI
jgi:hypothetical protein